MNKLIIILLPLIMCSCFDYTMGKKIPQNVYNSFKVGITTQEEVKSALGDPFMSTGNQYNDEILWSYNYTKGNALKANYVGLTTYFNFNGKKILLKKWQAHTITK